MASFNIAHEYQDGAYVEYVPSLDTVKFWAAYGLPDFEGPLEGFALAYPSRVPFPGVQSD